MKFAQSSIKGILLYKNASMRQMIYFSHPSVCTVYQQGNESKCCSAQILKRRLYKSGLWLVHFLLLTCACCSHDWKQKNKKKLIPVVFLVSCKKRVSGAFLSPHINLRFPSSVTSHLRSLRSCFFSASLSTRVSCSVFPSPFPLSVTVYPSFSTPFLSFRHIISCFRLDMHPSLNPRCLLACDTLLLNLIVFILKV